MTYFFLPVTQSGIFTLSVSFPSATPLDTLQPSGAPLFPLLVAKQTVLKLKILFDLWPCSYQAHITLFWGQSSVVTSS